MWNLIPWKKNGGDGGALAAEPFEREFSRIRNDFDSLMQRMWTGFPGFSDEFFESRFGLDVEETDTHYVASMPAPGFELSDFDVQVAGNRLIVKAERKQEEKGKNGSSFRYGEFQRTIPLPDGVNEDQITAKFENGILNVTVPLPQQATRKAKKIDIH